MRTMTSFKGKKTIISTFLKTCLMEGIIQFRDKKSIKKPLFTTFYLNVYENGILEVLTTDIYRKKTDAIFDKTGIEVIEPGVIPITNHEAILLCLGGKGIKGDVTFKFENNITFLETETDSYEIRQKSNKDLESLQSTEVIKHLTDWKSWHIFETVEETNEEGQVVLSYDKLFMNHPKIKVPYLTRVKIKKDDLMKVVSDTINITKDNKTKLVLKEGKLYAFKGEENASIKSKHEIPFENLHSEEVLEFDEDFYNFQAIIPNLFDEVEFHIRRVQANKTIAIYIRSIDKKTGIRACVGLVSIIKGGEEK